MIDILTQTFYEFIGIAVKKEAIKSAFRCELCDLYHGFTSTVVNVVYLLWESADRLDSLLKRKVGVKNHRANFVRVDLLCRLLGRKTEF